MEHCNHQKGLFAHLKNRTRRLVGMFYLIRKGKEAEEEEGDLIMSVGKGEDRSYPNQKFR